MDEVCKALGDWGRRVLDDRALWGLVQCVMALFIGMGSVIAAHQGPMPVGTAVLLGAGSLGLLGLGAHWVKGAKRPWRQSPSVTVRAA